MTTDQAGPYLRVLDELVPNAAHVTATAAPRDGLHRPRTRHLSEAPTRSSLPVPAERNTAGPSWCRNCGLGCGSATRGSWPRSRPDPVLGGGLSTTQLASADARAVLAIAPGPAEGLKVSKARVETALRRGGRQRRIATVSAGVIAALCAPQLRQDRLVEEAMRTETLALLIANAAQGRLPTVGSVAPRQMIAITVSPGLTRAPAGG